MKTLAAIAACALSLSAQPATYDIKPGPGNRFALEVFKTGLLSGKKHLFLFERYQGTLQYDAQAPERSTVDLTVETASMVLKDDWVKPGQAKDIHELAVGKDMLDIARHPQIRFVSKQITRSGSGFLAQGDLAIRGQAKPVAVTVTLKGEGPALELAGTAEVKLKDYGLKPPSAALGAIGTRNEMAVSFAVSARKR